MQTATKSGAKLLPADSEHNAIFQALHNEPPERIARLILTASGGSLRDHPLEDFEHITPAQALDHPNWDMGSKITIDSATMMNKGLEIIEAHWLFNTPVQNIEVVMHRESIIHSMVEFVDGSFLAQMGLPDMRVPLAHCLGWPERLPLKIPRLDPLSLNALHFEEIDPQRFPCLTTSIKVARQGGGAPAVLNGANEEAVDAFLQEEISYLDISKTLHSVMSKYDQITSLPESPSFLKDINTIEGAEQADQWGREQARNFMA
jgi:1-deoxy-D-xylulose-5-phosphate reductoisomerase